jgi:hypothetical protein
MNTLRNNYSLALMSPMTYSDKLKNGVRRMCWIGSNKSLAEVAEQIRDAGLDVLRITSGTYTSRDYIQATTHYVRVYVAE